MPYRTAWVLLVWFLLLALSGCEVVSAPPPDTTTTSVVLGVTPSPPSPTDVPAPPPAPVLLSRALAARQIGADLDAAQDLSALLNAYPNDPEAPQARFFLAESMARRGLWSAAAQLFRPFADGPTDDPLHAPALFWLARCTEEAGDHATAVDLYQRYRDLATPLEPYAAMRQAAQLVALGRQADAAAAYTHVARLDIVRGERAGSYERAIELHIQLGDPAVALDLYTELLDFAQTPTYRARILFDAASLAQQLGQAEQAAAWLRQLIADAPATSQAQIAVDQLLAAGDTALSPAAAAQVLMQAERWPEALTQFDLALAQAADLEVATELRRLRGMTLRFQGDFPAALAALSEAGAMSPNSEAGRQAQLDWIQTLGQSGEVERASVAYQEYAANYPDDPRAPDALDRAAQLRERLGDREGTLAIQRSLGERYPQSSQAASVLHRAAMALFRSGDYAQARAFWQILAEQARGEVQAQAAFWAARSAVAQSDPAAASALFRVALDAAPSSYYTARASEELGLELQGSVPLDAPLNESDWATLRAWVRSWPDQAAAPTPEELGLEADGSVRRATLLVEVGLGTEARNEWLAAIERWTDDPPRLAELARLAHSQGSAYVALRSAARLARLAPSDSPQPLVLERLLYPAPYPALLIQQSAERGLDPRLLYALLRQESLFDPLATSWVGARGMAQVMPATGEGIAHNLGLADFTLDDLYRPVVSVNFGAYYLSARMADMQGSIQGGLASYNGGLGNAQRWAGGSFISDPDLFTEGVDFAETRGYIKAVYGFYAVYQRIYTQP
ncbi:transglycosylase SLT domain-containing protein [Candidatus Oscillochloris fontis]|uniref:transglycosylase SLT domain-containing protein n=1 Tax=Candidatus Oscillochloris fontis TaxID=2496868 RepID=UPI0013754FE3|nr:transglycosylase SLT domain-containing protein [Candidatus Oscillochloris fontis]